MAFAIEKPFELLLDLEKVSWFLAFLALGCKATFIGLVYWICYNYKESKETFLFMSRVSDTYRNDAILPSVCVFDFVFEESGVLQLKRADVPQWFSWHISKRHLELVSLKW